MLTKTMVILAIAATLGSSASFTSALARGGRGLEGRDFRAGHFSEGLRARSAGEAHARDRGRVGGSYGQRDVWGHWGAYYGPMVPSVGR
jgi:hypothetical protein